MTPTVFCPQSEVYFKIKNYSPRCKLISAWLGSRYKMFAQIQEGILVVRNNSQRIIRIDNFEKTTSTMFNVEVQRVDDKPLNKKLLVSRYSFNSKLPRRHHITIKIISCYKPESVLFAVQKYFEKFWGEANATEYFWHLKKKADYTIGTILFPEIIFPNLYEQCKSQEDFEDWCTSHYPEVKTIMTFINGEMSTDEQVKFSNNFLDYSGRNRSTEVILPYYNS